MLYESAPGAEARGSGPELLFESRAPGLGGGGLVISDVAFPGHTFRLLERAEVTALGASNVQTFADQTLFTALYQLDLRDSTPDVVNDSDLLGAALLHTTTGTQDLSGAVSLTLEPGWYAIVVGAGRHGSPGGSPTHMSMINTGTTTVPMSRGPYTMNANTNAQVLQAATGRFFVEGHTLPPSQPAPGSFLMETARPSAWNTGSWSQVSTGSFHMVPFELTRATRLGEVGAWMMNGSGQVFAAIVQRSSPGANPPVPGSSAFANAVVGTALIPVQGGARAYSGDFGDLELPPGHYSLVLGSGMFGAEGSAITAAIEDQWVVDSMYRWQPGLNSWITFGIHYRFFLKGAQPTIAVAPDPADFGDVALGQTAARTITITNVDDNAAQLVGIGVNNNGLGQFSLDEDVSNCATALLAPQTSCQFTIHFSPTQLGEDSAIVQVFNDGLIETVVGDLAGTGVLPPEAEVKPALLSYEVLAGDSDSRALAIGNRGDLDLVWSLQAVVAADPFTAGNGAICDGPTAAWLSADPDTGVTAPGDDTVVTVVAATAGLTVGTHAAALCLNSNDPEQPVTVVPVFLDVTIPALSFDPTALNFGQVTVGDSGGPLNAVLHNTGSAAATGLSFVLVDDRFELAGDCGDTLAAGAQCQVQISFTPDQHGPASAVLEVSGDHAAAHAELPLSATGTAAVLEADPAQLSLVLVIGDSDSRTLTVGNSGNIALEWNIEVASSCDQHGGVDWLSADPAGGTTGPGGSTPVEVVADAEGLTAGDYAAELCLSGNTVQGEVLVVPVALTVTAPALTFEPADIDFGKVEIGTTAKIPVTLSNHGDAAATDLQLQLGGRAGAASMAGFSMHAGDCGDELPAGGACTFSVSFAPPLLGTAQALLTAASTEGAGAELPLIGQGVTSEDLIFGDRFE